MRSMDQRDDTRREEEDVLDENEDEDELPALEFARCHGLCRNHRLEDAFETCISSKLNSHACLRESTGDRCDPPTSADILKPERLSITEEALVLLQDVMKPRDDYDLMQALPPRHPRRQLHMELPLLRTDHEMDVRGFGRRPDPQLHTQKHPPVEVDVEADESLEWPKRYLDLPRQILGVIESAELECPREAMQYLQEIIVSSTDPMDGDLNRLYEEAENVRRGKRVEPLTLPLLPLLSPALTPFDPSSDTAQLPLLSDSSDSLDAEVARVQQDLQEHDRILPLSSNEAGLQRTDELPCLPGLYPPILSDLASDLPATPPRCRRDGLIMDVPILQEDYASSSLAESIRSVAYMGELNLVVPSDPHTIKAKPTDDNSELSFQAFFDEFIIPNSKLATDAIDNEQLQAADAVYRVDVPIMDFSCPVPPWRAYCRTVLQQRSTMTEVERQKQLLNDIIDVHDLAVWHGLSKLSRRLLWCPFPPKLGKVMKEGGIDDLRYLEVFMNGMSSEDVVTSDDVVWKPEGLRVLREDEVWEEEDLEMPRRNDEEPCTLGDGTRGPRKRAREEEPFDPLGHLEAHRVTSDKVLINCMPDTPGLESFPFRGEGTARSDGKFFGSHFQTFGALASLMGAYGHAIKRPRNEEIRVSRVDLSTLVQPAAPDTKSQELSPTCRNDAQLQVPFKFPTLPNDTGKRWCILSTYVFQNERSLLKGVSSLMPNATSIERDFSSVPTAPEADIILSPATGLVLTSIQKVKQKTLPGSKSILSSIQQRVASLARRYERLAILIGDALSLDLGSDPRDTEALAEFSSFCLTFEADIQILLVPTGEDALSHWVVMCMHQFGVSDPRLEILQDETVWEQFLRRCGFNAFAAQAILLNLNRTADPSESSTEAVGIRGFVAMHSEERVARFENLLGGRRVLDRVNCVLEREWLSARTGFRTQK